MKHPLKIYKNIASAIFIAALSATVLIGCSREQTIAVSQSAAKSYLESNRDHIIENWQARVASTPACAEFKMRFKTAGSRYADGANGAFVQDMFKVWDATKTAGCAAQV